MNAVPDSPDLVSALKAAGSAHHEYEQTVLDGVFDEHWPMFYAAYVLGRVGDFVAPSVLSRWLAEVPTGGDWAIDAADYVLDEMRR